MTTVEILTRKQTREEIKDLVDTRFNMLGAEIDRINQRINDIENILRRKK